MQGLMAEKIGMTQIYDDGVAVPVTVLKVEDNVIVDVRTVEKNGYSAVLLGSHDQAEKRMTKSLNGFYKKAKVQPKKNLREFRLDDATAYEQGKSLNASVLQVGDVVDVQGVSKGKGFQGVMKRYNFGGGPDAHGCSVAHRVPGSIGQGTFPGKVIKGKKMAGHMGAERVTVKNLQIAGVEAEQGLILIKGAVPGRKGSVVNVYLKVEKFADRLKQGVDEGEQQESQA